MTYKYFLRRILLLLYLLLYTAISLMGQNINQNVNVTQVFRPTAEIVDSQLIEQFLEGLILAEDPSEVEKIEILDITNNGFGPDDMVVIHPSLNIHPIDQPDPSLTEIMRSWSFEEQQRDGINELSADYYYPEEADTLDLSLMTSDQMIELAQNSILSDLLESLKRNYESMPISLRFERDEEGFTFQLWNYQENAFSFKPRPPAVPDSIGVYDMMYVLYSDSTIIADTTYYDLMYINKTVENTIYLPEEREVITNKFNTQSLPRLQFNGRARID